MWNWLKPPKGINDGLLDLDVEVVQSLILHLRSLAEGTTKPLKNHLGICHEVRSHQYDLHPLVERIMKTWPECSGEDKFPVRHPRLDADKAFTTLYKLWDDDEYGKARIRLCIFIADELQKLIDNEG